MILGRLWRALPLISLFTGYGTAIDLDVNNEESVKSAASTVAFDMMTYYTYNQSGQIPGKLNGTWWEGGALFKTLIEYWYFTGDSSYNEVVTQGMLWQSGEDHNYLPSNYTHQLGNDDQVFWGLAAMTAAELNYPAPPEGSPSWLGLAQAVLNTQVLGWDTRQCNGGLHWQIFPIQSGYNLKNSVSNGGLFQLAARLALYTGNSSYAVWAERIWDWTAGTPLLNTKTWHVADSTDMNDNCTSRGDYQWSYNYGIYLSGAAYMFNYTNGSDAWRANTEGLLDVTLQEFFPSKYGGKIMSEVACEPNMSCDRNQACFKGLTSAWLGFITYLVPGTGDKIMPVLLASATAAANQCSGGANGRMCGLTWYPGQWNGKPENQLEQEMSVLSVMTQTLAGRTGGAPVRSDNGGTSVSDPGLAGDGGHTDPPTQKPLKPITTADRAGAGILTALVLAGIIGGTIWLLSE